MEVILSNGTSLTPIVVTGESRYVQGSNRDCLSFIFSASSGLSALDSAFTESACESIKIIEDGGDIYIHKGYTIRAGLKKESVETNRGTSEEASTYEDRITVTMAQRTYAESQIATLTTESVDTQLAVAELAEIVMGGATNG